MLPELKRCNSIGNKDGVVFLVSIISGRKRVGFNELVNRCSLEKNIVIQCKGAIAFLQYLGFLNSEDDVIIPTGKFEELCSENDECLITVLVKECIKKLSEDGLFDKDSTGFNPESGHLSIKRSAFPLAYAAIRNFLTMAGVLEKEINGEIGVSSVYESDFSEYLRKRKEKFTLEELLQKQAEQSKQGLLAEEFVLNYELNRLPNKKGKIKRISDYDVSAGYDIVSFKNDDSKIYDRFIEVKSYKGTLHFFWSENELDVAKLKSENYYLCLVDINRIHEVGYEPEFICNPTKEILNNNSWLVNPASYKIKRIEGI